MTILNAFERWRDFHKLSVSEMARASGAARQTVNGWFNGSASPSIEHVQKLEKWRPGLWAQLSSVLLTTTTGENADD